MTRTLSSLIGRAILAPVSQFWRDENGVTAIEFGILAPPFFAIIGAILQTAMAFLSSQVLDGAVNDASRAIRIGQLQSVQAAQVKFKALVCDRLFGLFGDCSGLHVEVKTLDTFAAARPDADQDPMNSVCKPDCTWKNPEQFIQGKGSSTVIVKVYYKWPLILPTGVFSPNALADGTLLLGSVRVFRNEPF